MMLRKHLPRQLEVKGFLDSLKRMVRYDYDIPIPVKELNAEYKESIFFKDIYKYIPKGQFIEINPVLFC